MKWPTVKAEMQQNSFNMEILIIQHFRRVVSTPGAVYQKKAPSVKQPDLGALCKKKKASKSAVTSTVMISADLLPPTPSTSSAVRIPENQKRTLMTLNQQLSK
jgi:hypothetical protein